MTAGRPTGGRRRPAPALLALLTAVLLAHLPGVAVAELVPPPRPLLEGPVPVTWPAAPEVAAPAYLLVDATTGQVLAARAADEPRPVASTIKILTALTVADRIALDEVVEAGPEVLDLEGASVDLEPGERWSVEQLLQGLLLRSGNDAAETLAVAVAGDRDAFLELMIEDAERVGLRVGPGGTVLRSPSGLDDAQVLTARDLATLARVLLTVPELREIVAMPEVELPGIGTDTNRNLLIGDYPGATGIKTGYTEAAGNSLVASAARDGRELVAVVLGAGEDPERFGDAAALLDHGFAAFADRQVAAELTLLLAGTTRTLRIEPRTIVAPADAEVDVDLPIPVRAPEPGEIDVRVRVGGTPVASLPADVVGQDPPPVDGSARLGRAIADGTYAALRAAHAAERLPTAAG